MVQGCLNVYNREQLKEFLDWIKDKNFITPRGWYIDLSLYHRGDYILNHCNLPETGNYDKNHLGYYTGEKNGNFGEQLMNPDTFVCNYLYHNCPIQFVQDWLEYAFNGKDKCRGDFEDISVPLKLPVFETATKIKILKKGKSNKSFKYFYANINGKKEKINVSGNYYISIKDLNEKWFSYNSKMNHWILPNELDYKDTWTISYKKSIKAIIRKILKEWKLPKNTIIYINGGASNGFYDWKLITK